MILAIIQARMSSKRLPGKVLMSLNGQPILWHLHQAVSRATGIDKIVVATSTDESDWPIYMWCADNKVPVYRGSLNDVLDRFYQCAKDEKADVIIRLTADCPLIPTAEIQRVLDAYNAGVAEYVSNRPEAPDGWDCEVFSFRALEETWNRVYTPETREHVTLAMKMQRDYYPQRLEAPKLSVDSAEDFDRVKNYL